MKKIGITGGIGSGKTTVCNIFNVLGVPVFHADEVARVLQDMDADIRSGMIDLFGEAIYFANGKLDRKKVAALIFINPALKNKVNLLVHPKVKKNFLDWTAKNQSEDYILYEAAILFETGSYSGFDYNILVTASEQVRIDRVVKRDHTNEEAVLDRIRNQMSDEEKIPLADFIIENNEKQLIIPQIVHLDKIFRNNGKIR